MQMQMGMEREMEMETGGEEEEDGSSDGNGVVSFAAPTANWDYFLCPQLEFRKAGGRIP